MCTATPTSTRASVAAASAPLHRAPHCHSVRNVVVLQHGGVDECARDGEGRVPQQVARHRRDTHAVQYTTLIPTSTSSCSCDATACTSDASMHCSDSVSCIVDVNDGATRGQ